MADSPRSFRDSLKPLKSEGQFEYLSPEEAGLPPLLPDNDAEAPVASELLFTDPPVVSSVKEGSGVETRVDEKPPLSLSEAVPALAELVSPPVTTRRTPPSSPQNTPSSREYREDELAPLGESTQLRFLLATVAVVILALLIVSVSSNNKPSPLSSLTNLLSTSGTASSQGSFSFSSPGAGGTGQGSTSSNGSSSSGFGQASTSGSGQGTSSTKLTITATDSTKTTKKTVLSCKALSSTYAGYSLHPPHVLCASASSQKVKAALVSPSTCSTQTTGSIGPETATITGTLDGTTINQSYSRFNICQEARFEAVLALLPLVVAPTTGGSSNTPLAGYQAPTRDTLLFSLSGHSVVMALTPPVSPIFQAKYSSGPLTLKCAVGKSLSVVTMVTHWNTANKVTVPIPGSAPIRSCILAIKGAVIAEATLSK